MRTLVRFGGDESTVSQRDDTENILRSKFIAYKCIPRVETDKADRSGLTRMK
jgi:hypothetical protein